MASRSGLHEIITNTGWLFFDRILSRGASLIIGVWIACYLGVGILGTTFCLKLIAPMLALLLATGSVFLSNKNELLTLKFCNILYRGLS